MTEDERNLLMAISAIVSSRLSGHEQEAFYALQEKVLPGARYMPGWMIAGFSSPIAKSLRKPRRFCPF